MDNYTLRDDKPRLRYSCGKRAYSRNDAEYFEAWIDRTTEVTSQYPDWNSRTEKELVLRRLHEARSIYEHLH